jgi:hypothetical protein
MLPALTKNINVIYRKEKWYVLESLFGIYTYFFINRFSLLISTKIPSIFFLLIISFIVKYLFLSPFEIPNSIFDHTNIVMSNKLIYNMVSKNIIKFIKDEPYSLYKNYLVLKSKKIIYSDLIIMCTGYETDLNFLKNENNQYNYLHILDINQTKCGYIGFTPSYNWIQVSYLQSEWFINYIIGNINLPDHNVLKKKINTEIEKKKKLNLNYNDLTYNCFEYCDRLNNELNKKNNKSKLSYWLLNPTY